jgi:hypothetical protein
MWPYLPQNPCGCDSCESSNESTTDVGSDNVRYVGPPLVCTGIEPCDTLTTVLQKIDAKICALVAQLGVCCTTTTTTSSSSTTTTTTTTVYCENYIVQGIADPASWSGLDCDGRPIGGSLNSGGTATTGCMQADSLDLTNANIKVNLGPC